MSPLLNEHLNFTKGMFQFQGFSWTGAGPGPGKISWDEHDVVSRLHWGVVLAVVVCFSLVGARFMFFYEWFYNNMRASYKKQLKVVNRNSSSFCV